jgi:hypothetical protein
MTRHPTHYRLTESREEYDAGTTFQLVARYGDWHPYDAKLEPVDDELSGAVTVTIDELFDAWTGIVSDAGQAAGATA